MGNVAVTGRTALLRRGRQFEYFTILYNSLEGLVGVGAGLLAGSIALVGFGFDSAIEVTSGAALYVAISGSGGAPSQVDRGFCGWCLPDWDGTEGSGYRDVFNHH